MSTTESALPATPEAAPPSSPQLDSGLLTDAQMIEIFGNEYTPSASPATPEAAGVPAKEATAAPAAEEESLLDATALEALDTPEAEKPGTAGTTPASDPFIEKLKTAIPNDVALGYAVTAFKAQTAFEEAIANGNLADAIKVMPAAGKLFQAGLAQTMANPEFEKRVVENFIRKHSPENQNPIVDALRAEVETLKGRFQNADQQADLQRRQQAQQQQVADTKAAVTRIDQEIGSLFDRVRFTKNEADRNMVSALFKVELSSNPAIMQRALSGDLASMRPIFKKVTTEFADREKARTIRAGSTKNTPAPILTGAGVAAETPLKGMDAALAKAALFVANNPRK